MFRSMLQSEVNEPIPLRKVLTMVGNMPEFAIIGTIPAKAGGNPAMAPVWRLRLCSLIISCSIGPAAAKPIRASVTNDFIITTVAKE
jgi:hypothetical protein